MDPIGLVVLLLIVGVVIAFVPMDATIKNVVVGLVVILVILSLARGFGWIGSAHRFAW